MKKPLEYPIFAVVGHPNQGKSSVVSTLVQDDHIAISPVSGTTREAHSYRLVMGEDILYELVDTPGFQRARQILEWCTEHSSSATDHPRMLATFVARHREEARYADDIALLAPIIEGAGIVYVVDAEQPFSHAFDAELILLSWSAQPRLALINSYGEGRYETEWRSALQQYFSLVRNFNPLAAPFAQHIALLQSMAEIHLPWREDLRRGADALQQQRESRHQQAADHLVQYLQSVLQYKLQLPVIGAKESIRSAGFSRYNQELQSRERTMRQKISTLYGYHQLDWESEWQTLQAADLTDAHEWRVWGLPRRRLASLSAAAGAVSGLAVDVAVGGSSLLMGAIAGGALGALAGGFAGRDPLTFELVSKAPGYEQWQLGPVASLEFAVALVGRALRSWYQIRLRNHARRDALMLESQNLSVWLDGLERKQQVQLLFWLKKLLKAPLNESEQRQFKVLLLALGEQMETETAA